MKTVVADTSFLIAVANRDDAHHGTAVAWLKELDHRKVVVYIPTVAIAEFSLRGEFGELMAMGDFLPVEFALDDALECGTILDAWEARKSPKDKPTSRIALKDDIKILATTQRLKASHLITADDKQMSKVAKALELCRVIPCDKPVDKSFFNKDGQKEIECEGMPAEPHGHARHGKKTTRKA